MCEPSHVPNKEEINQDKGTLTTFRHKFSHRDGKEGQAASNNRCNV